MVGATGAWLHHNTTMSSDESIGPIDKPIIESRSISLPRKPKRGCTAICRADANDNILGNITKGDATFAFETATSRACEIAVKVAKRQATRYLGKQPKHVGCRTAGK